MIGVQIRFGLYRPYDLGLDKNQMYLIKDPYIQNFMSFAPLGAMLQHPPIWSLHTLLSPFYVDISILCISKQAILWIQMPLKIDLLFDSSSMRT